MHTIYVLIQAHALIDVHTPAAQNTSHQIHAKICPKTLKFEWYFGLFGCRTCANHYFLANKGPFGSYVPYMCIVGTRQQALLLKLTDVHPSPCTRALPSIRKYTVYIYLLN